MRFYRKNLLETDYRAGFPIPAVAVEAGEPGTPNPVVTAARRIAAADSVAVFEDLGTQQAGPWRNREVSETMLPGHASFPCTASNQIN
ncbi:hypothetical protein [Mycolicibacterium sarraceniae]|uniref:Uncharacterized protein n=1 Tax=Mycolicibacterium sarraceniae TaxID=1534348 RepID=A0A7I7SNK6_9MYCO|nr:hypothetical protein [Mycolicibacterium sarraceniae]BBY58552.1 hypothetical protein MSAR_16880 [Mycolicibacterium sarraceniae]